MHATNTRTRHEYRSANLQPGGRVVELPGGSAPDRTAAMGGVAAEELWEETGLRVDAARLEHVSTRQVASTLVATGRTYRVCLTSADLDAARHAEKAGPVGELADDAEVTWVQVRTVTELEASGQGDWATLGQVRSALGHTTAHDRVAKTG